MAAMPSISLWDVPGARRVVSRLDRALRLRADEEIGRHLDGLYGRLDQINDRLDDLERRLDRTVERHD
jgi:hypothetical protein